MIKFREYSLLVMLGENGVKLKSVSEAICLSADFPDDMRWIRLPGRPATGIVAPAAE
jgi:hypothetical protein